MQRKGDCSPPLGCHPPLWEAGEVAFVFIFLLIFLIKRKVKTKGSSLSFGEGVARGWIEIKYIQLA
jgi:hypothetical protein